MNNSLLESISDSTSITDIKHVLEEYTASIGGDFFIYVAFSQFPFSAPTGLAITNYAVDWQKRYEEKGYFAIDPVIKHCMSSLTPIYWNELDDLDKPASEMMRDASMHGLASGITMSINSASGPSAVVSFASKKENDTAFYKKLKKDYSGLYLFAVYIHEYATKLYDPNVQIDDAEQLSKRERECLVWAAEGKTASEIGLILGVHERTAIFHLNNSVKKLKANNRQQAIARALVTGQISTKHSLNDFHVKFKTIETE